MGQVCRDSFGDNQGGPSIDHCRSVRLFFNRDWRGVLLLSREVASLSRQGHAVYVCLRAGPDGSDLQAPWKSNIFSIRQPQR